MKKILKISSLAFLLITGIACENDDQTIATAKGGPELIAPASGTEYVLSPLSATNEATTLIWNHADYDVQTEVNYEVQFALAGTDFATVIPGGTTTSRFMTFTVEGLNAIALEAGLMPYTAADLDVRVKGTLGANASMESLSNVITLNITPYTTELPQLAVPGNHQGWNPPSAPRIASSGFGETDYEGFLWLDGEFKFVAPDAAGIYDWNHGPDYGDDGSFSGVLVETGESNATATAGYYRVKADTDALTYAVEPMTWAIIGDGTPGGWGTDTPMTYNNTTKKWSAIVTLTDQPAPDHGLKFRANGAWDVNFGDTGADGLLEYSGTNIGTTAGTYLIELDLSHPRAYTYTMTAQ
jgi:starch-binding outer membrane protein SusE/F